MKFASPWLRLWKLSRIRIEIKTSIGRFREKGGYIIKQEMQKKLFHTILLVTFSRRGRYFQTHFHWYLLLFSMTNGSKVMKANVKKAGNATCKLGLCKNYNKLF